MNEETEEPAYDHQMGEEFFLKVVILLGEFQEKGMPFSHIFGVLGNVLYFICKNEGIPEKEARSLLSTAATIFYRTKNELD